ncbi:MAG: LLM class flavin-dependent oxidoreductase [Betaproteobacteria bacterium]|nr:LLM class flavin-dependent oxidoreductase [Betaproteobacteria bacterium]
MKLGYFTMPLHPPSRNYVETLKEDREAIILADQLGFVEALVGEHVTDAAETVTDCATFLASLIHSTKTIKLGTGTLNLPNGHPAQLAATVSMLDNMLEGRFVLGISPGGLPSDWEVFGNLTANRNAKFVECINQMIAIWTGEPPYNIKGEYWNISTEKTMIPDIGQGIFIKPYQRPYPPIVVTAVEPFSKGVTEAAKRGWDPVSANFLLPKWQKSHWGKYVEGCEAAGRPIDAANWRVAKTIFVADDDKTAREYAYGPKSPYHFYYKQIGYKLVRAGRAVLFKEDKEQPDSDITPDYLVDKLVIAGSVDKVVDEIIAMHEYLGDFGILYYCGMDWVDGRLAKRSMALMAEQVMPRVNQAIARR